MGSEDNQDSQSLSHLARLPNSNRFSNTSDASSDDSALSLNELDRQSSSDVQGVSLLKQIFPEESTEELRRLHLERITPRSTTPDPPRKGTPHESRLGNRIRRRLPGSLSWREQSLPHDFLRLPPDVAVRRFREEDCRWHYELVGELEQRALEQHSNPLPPMEQSQSGVYYSRAIYRDVQVGLGMNLFEEGGDIRVYSLNDRLGESCDDSSVRLGPASRAGIRPGDVLIGINGRALVQSVSTDEGILQHAVSALRLSPDPVVLHLLRDRLPSPPETVIARTQSLLDTSDMVDEAPSVELSFQLETSFRTTPMLPILGSGGGHPFIRLLASKKLIRQGKAEQSTSRVLRQLTERARQWEAIGSFTVRSNRTEESTFVPLMGVRKALCIRIVNSFLEGDETAYTIWVYDLESCREWYAPVRYFRDFMDLRAATYALHPSIPQLPFPKLTIFGSPVRTKSRSDQELKRHQLESYLRSLSAMIYREALHPSMAEIAIYLQSFLGCDAVLGSTDLLGLIAAESPVCDHGDYESQVRVALKRSIQRYAYRLFLLPPLSSAVETFITSVLNGGPRLKDIENLEAEGRSILKARAVEDLKRIQTFLDQLQELILAGCMDDFRSIAEREDYEALHPRIRQKLASGDDFWERLVREAVREQIEIEVYVPLRGVVSRWLVNGWKAEDMEVHFKIKELRRRPESFFHLSESDMTRLEPVAEILRGGVGQSTLPCVKLRAIVDAASEISKIFAKGRNDCPGGNNGNGTIYMGADDFLPVFIYCVVKADMQRPCALCILLQTLCDPINRIGETGYYLASFEAAITHFQELDLSEHRDEAQSSFISIALDS